MDLLALEDGVRRVEDDLIVGGKGRLDFEGGAGVVRDGDRDKVNATVAHGGRPQALGAEEQGVGGERQGIGVRRDGEVDEHVGAGEE